MTRTIATTTPHKEAIVSTLQRHSRQCRSSEEPQLSACTG